MMERHYILFVIFLFLSINLQLPPSIAHGDECSRADSRAAREIVEAKVLSVARARGVDLALEGCPLHPSLDRYRAQEEGKVRVRDTLWKCGSCGKQFKNEHFLDRHLGNRHPIVEEYGHGSNDADNTNEGVAGSRSHLVCLSDYCEVLGCGDDDDHTQHSSSHLSSFSSEHYRQRNKLFGCQPAKMERAQYLCKSIVHKCFPLDKNQLTHDLHDELIADLCGPLSCERHALRLSDEAAEKSIRTRQRMWYVALVFAVVLLTLFYLAMWTYRSEFNHAKDLHRLSLPSSNSNVTLTAWAYAILYSCLPFLPPPKKKKKLF